MTGQEAAVIDAADPGRLTPAPGSDPGQTVHHHMTPVAAPESVRTSRLSGRLTAFGPWLLSLRNPLIGAAILIAVWQLSTMTGLVKFYVLPAPLDVVAALGDNSKALIKHATATLTVAIAGFAIGTASAVLVAMLFTYSKVARRTLYPTMIALRALPFIAIIPILVILMGTGYEPRITICALGSYFVTLVSMMRGLRSADGDVEELMHTLGATSVQRLLKVRLHAALPYLLSAMRISASGCIIEATVAEWIAGNVGLGYLIQISGYTFNLTLMWAAIVVAAAITLALIGILSSIERVATPWIPSKTLAARTAPAAPRKPRARAALGTGTGRA